MKEKNWDDSLEGEEAREFFDSTAIMVDEEPAEDLKVTVTAGNHLTDLRRRIEERMDSKRIAHEFDYEDLDDLLDDMD